MTVRTNGADEIYLNDIKNFSGNKGIIDNILTWSNNLDLILIYFEFLCKVFEKYGVGFRLDRCELLKDRVKNVGHDLTPTGNVPENLSSTLLLTGNFGRLDRVCILSLAS